MTPRRFPGGDRSSDQVNSNQINPSFRNDAAGPPAGSSPRPVAPEVIPATAPPVDRSGNSSALAASSFRSSGRSSFSSSRRLLEGPACPRRELDERCDENRRPQVIVKLLPVGESGTLDARRISDRRTAAATKKNLWKRMFGEKERVIMTAWSRRHHQRCRSNKQGILDQRRPQGMQPRINVDRGA
jgi:hypothetical protein